MRKNVRQNNVAVMTKQKAKPLRWSTSDKLDVFAIVPTLTPDACQWHQYECGSSDLGQGHRDLSMNTAVFQTRCVCFE